MALNSPTSGGLLALNSHTSGGLLGRGLETRGLLGCYHLYTQSKVLILALEQ